METQINWISIKDKLPEDQQRVLFYDKESNDIYSGRYETDCVGWDFVDDGEVGYYSDEDNVTHWVPMLDKPKD